MTYRVTVWSEPNGAWGASADDVDGAHTFGDSLPEVERHIREAIAVVLDLPRGAEDTMELDIHVSVSDEVDELVESARQARAAAGRAAELTTAAVLALRRRGISGRDAARVLRISSGRVSQIERENAAA